MRKSLKLVIVPQQPSQLRYQIDEQTGELRVFDEAKVRLSEVLPHLMKPKRAYSHFCRDQQQISWKALQEHNRTRSVDDIRNYWMLKVVPII